MIKIDGNGFDPHGSIPVVIDADALSPQDSREALLDFFREQASKDMVHLSPLLQLKPAQLEALRDRFAHGEDRTQQEKDESYAQARRRIDRNYIREKYGLKGDFWCGEGRPPWEQR